LETPAAAAAADQEHHHQKQAVLAHQAKVMQVELLQVHHQKLLPVAVVPALSAVVILVAQQVLEVQVLHLQLVVLQ
jgi:hypothetical protein